MEPGSTWRFARAKGKIGNQHGGWELSGLVDIRRVGGRAGPCLPASRDRRGRELGTKRKRDLRPPEPVEKGVCHAGSFRGANHATSDNHPSPIAKRHNQPGYRSPLEATPEAHHPTGVSGQRPRRVLGRCGTTVDDSAAFSGALVHPATPASSFVRVPGNLATPDD